MKLVLEIIAAATVVLVSILAVLIISTANIYAGASLGLILVICGSIAVRQRRKHPHIPFSSPGFLATFGVAFVLLAPAFRDLEILALIISALMILLSLLIMAATRTAKHMDKRKNPQQGGPGYPPQGVGSPDP